MEYKYSPNINYEDFASGRVLYNAGGIPNFPVRLINEIFNRCLQYSAKKKDICIYDCCCGGSYSLTVLGLLNQSHISEILASDIDDKMIEVSKKNLALLSKDGMNQRINEIHLLYEKYGKESHKDAEASAIRLLGLLERDIEVQIFKANILEGIKLNISPDIIITDIPYGNLVSWEGGEGNIDNMLNSLAAVCTNETIVGVCMDKKQKPECTSFKRLEKHNIGKRKFELYKL